MALSVVGMLTAFGGVLPPVSGALFQELIDLGAVLNALRAAVPGGVLSDYDAGGNPERGIIPAAGNIPHSVGRRIRDSEANAPKIDEMRRALDWRATCTQAGIRRVRWQNEPNARY